MLVVLGLLCIGWTAYELAGLMRQPRERAPVFEAWDENGRPLRVEQVTSR